MAPSSLKKMSGVQERKEGNYASSEKISRGRFTNSDLGLTLLPGSQIQREDEKRSEATAKNSPKKPESKYVERLEPWASFETEIQAEHPAQKTTFLDKANSPSSSSSSGSESPESSYVTTRTNRKWPFSQDFNSKDTSSVVQYNADSAAAALYDEQKSGTGEVRNAQSCQHGNHSSRVMRQRKLGSHSSNESRDSKVSKGQEGIPNTHIDVHHDQSLLQSNDVRSERGKKSFPTMRLPSGGTAGGSRPSKPVSHRQIKGSAFRDSASELVASSSPAKHQHYDLEKLVVPYQYPNPSNPATKQSKHSRLLPDSPADVQREVLKGVKNRSWTNYFPAKARFPRRANLTAPSFLPAPFTPNEDREREDLVSAPSISTDLPANKNFLSTPPSPSLPKYCNLSKALDYLLHICVLADNLDAAYAGRQHQSARRRSVSMPNLWSTRETLNMDSTNQFGPASLPTPPREQPRSPACLPYSSPLSQYDNAWPDQSLFRSSHDHVDKSFHAYKFSQQNCQLNSSFQLQHKIELSDRQNMALASSLHGCQGPTQIFNHQDMTGLSASKDGLMASSGSQHVRRRLEVKPNYTHEEVKSLMLHFVKQAQKLQAENATLQSANIAMKKGVGNVHRENTVKTQQIQRYEQIVAQKDRLIETMKQKGSSLERQYKQVWDNYHRLIAALRKENGSGNPSAIAQKIRWNHTSSAFGAAGQGSQSSANAFPAYCTGDAQLFDLRHGPGQTSTGIQGYFQPVSVPSSSEADVMDTSSQSLRHQEYSAGNHSSANQFQTLQIHAYTGMNVANASSRSPVQQETATVRHQSAGSPHDLSTRWAQSNQSLGAPIGTMLTNAQNNNRPAGQALTERVTIDLTEDFQSPSSSAPRDISVHETRQTSVQGEHFPFDPLTENYAPGQYPARHLVSNQFPSGPSAQNQTSQSQPPPNQDSQGTNQEAVRIQREAFARMAEKPLSWLQGENPFRKGTETEQRTALPVSKRSLQSNAEEHVSVADYLKAGNVAPLPETAPGPKIKNQVPKKTKSIFTAEARKERAKAYRKTAADKKRRESEAAKQLFQDESVFNNAMRGQKQDRRAIKGGKRQEQARKSLGEVGRREPQRTLDCKFYQEDADVQQAGHHGSTEHVASDDCDSLFGDDEDNQMEVEVSEASPEADSALHDDNADVEGNMAAYVAEVEALLAADEDAGNLTDHVQYAAHGGEDFVPAAPPGSDDGYHDFSCTSEESEEE